MIVKREDMRNTLIAAKFRQFLAGYDAPSRVSLRSEGLAGVRVSAATADQLFYEYRANNIEGLYIKGLRPWEMLNFRTEKHPDADVMIGVEVECGFGTEKKLRAAYTYLMDECDYATGDVEGPGKWPLEATFPPVPSDQLLAEGCQVRGFYKNILSKQQEFWRKGAAVGTHFNVSWPGMGTPGNQVQRRVEQMSSAILREEDFDDDSYCCESCNGDYDSWEAGRYDRGNTCSGSTENTVKLFGRMPYGGLYYQSISNTNHWVEMKLFNSTTDINKLAWYKQVALEITAWLRDKDSPVSAKDMLAELATRSPLDSSGKLAKLPAVKKPRARKTAEVKRAAAR